MNTNIIQKAGKMRNGGSMLWFMNLQMDLSCEASNHISSEVRFLFHFSLGLIITTKPCRSSKKKNISVRQQFCQREIWLCQREICLPQNSRVNKRKESIRSTSRLHALTSSKKLPFAHSASYYGHCHPNVLPTTITHWFSWLGEVMLQSSRVPMNTQRSVNVHLSVDQEASWYLCSILLLSHSVLYFCNSGCFYCISFNVNCIHTLLQCSGFGFLFAQ